MKINPANLFDAKSFPFVSRIISSVGLLVALLSGVILLSGCSEDPGMAQFGNGGGDAPAAAANFSVQELPNNQPGAAPAGGGGGGGLAPPDDIPEGPTTADFPPPGAGGGGRDLPGGKGSMMSGGGGFNTQPGPVSTGPAGGGGKGAMMSGGGGFSAGGGTGGVSPPGGEGEASSGAGNGGVFGNVLGGLFGGGRNDSGPARSSGYGALFPQMADGSNAGGSGDSSASYSSSVDYQELANQNFSGFNEIVAVNDLYGFFLTEEDAFEKYPLQWYPGLAEPRAFLRVGIGVEYSPDKDHQGIPPLIGDPNRDDQNTNSSPGFQNTPSTSRYANVDVSKPGGFLLYYTGDYIERLFKRLDDRRTTQDAYYGGPLRDAVMSKANRTGGDLLAPPSGSDFAGGGVAPPSGGGSPVAAGAGGGGSGKAMVGGIGPPTGGVGPPTGGIGPPGGSSEGGIGPPAGGGGGDNTPAGLNSGPNNLLRTYSTSSTASKPSDRVYGTLIPGIMTIGEGKTEELVATAAKMNLDLVMVFEVKVTESRRKFSSNVIIRVFNPKNPGEELFKTKALRNTLVAEEREKRSDDDPVEEVLDKLFQDFMDTQFRAAAMPELKPEHVESRVDSLVTNPVDKLRAAVEVMGYYRMGLLQPARAQSAIDEILTGGGALLVTGDDQEEKSKFVKNLIEENSASAATAAGFR